MCDVVDDQLRQRIAVGLDELRLSAYELLAQARLADGQHDRVAGDLADIVRQHPTREHLAGLLMTALYRAGRQVDALAVYREVHDALSTEYGVDPGPELTRLHRQVLTNDDALSAPAPVKPVPTVQAAPRSGRSNLPRQIGDFVGREAELIRLDGLVREAGPQPAVVITAIGGAGGIGKTALAVLRAHRAADHFPDGQLYINLHGYDGGRPIKPVDALPRLLRALGIPTDQLPTDPDQAADLFRATVADKKMIFILDNARAADQVRPLHCTAGRWDDAETCGQEALHIPASHGFRPNEGYALTVLAETSLGRGDLEKAAGRAETALDVQHAAGALLAEPRARAVLHHARTTSHREPGASSG